MTDYLPLLVFAAVLTWMLLRARAEEEKRGERSRAGTLLLWLSVPIAIGVVFWQAANGDTIGDAIISSLPLLIFAAIAVVLLATRGEIKR